MIGVDPGLIRSSHARRVSAATDGMGPYQPAPVRGTGMHHAHDTTDPQAKLQIIENLLSSSPPLPAPPLMQQSAILAQERELEQQMNRLHLQKQQHPSQHRPSVTALTIDPVYTVVAPPAQPAKSALSAQLQPRMAAAAAAAAASNSQSSPQPQNSKQANNAAATSDWFAKVDVAPRAAPVASSFVPSSLSAALNDSGLLFRQQAGGGRGDDFARVSTRDARGGASNKSTKGRLPDINSNEDTFTIFLHPYSDVRVRPARIRLQLPSSHSAQSDSPPANQTNVQQCNPTSDEIVANLLEKWSSGELSQNFGLRANLNPAAASKDKWCLRMVDEDTVGDDDDDDDDDDEPSNTPMKEGEEIGMPEEDLPPLERNKPIRMFGAQVLAMTVADGVEHKMSNSLHLSTNTNSPPTSPVAARPASPSTSSPPPPTPAAATSNAPTTPSSRNPASTQQQIRRYDTMRVTPTHATASSTASKMRTVSVFSGMTSLLDSNGQVVASPSRADNRAYSVETSSTGPTSPLASEKVYLKVHIGDHETHVVPLLKSQLLADALPIVSAKKHALVAMKAEHYRFSYVDPLLGGRNEQLKDMSRITVGQLASDELNLAPRSLAGEQGTTAGGLGATTPNLLANKAEMNSSSIPVSHLERGSIMIPTEAPSLSSFQFTMDTASNYTEYKVIKTNQRGKRQHRIFGIDRFKIYNKTQSGADEGESGGMFSFISKLGVGDQGVSRAHRMINTIASVHVVSLRPTCFCISFKADSRKDSPIAQTREYETETKMEAAEIVAKLRFLMAHSQPDHSNAASSVANAGLLSQSIK